MAGRRGLPGKVNGPAPRKGSGGALAPPPPGHELQAPSTTMPFLPGPACGFAHRIACVEGHQRLARLAQRGRRQQGAQANVQANGGTAWAALNRHAMQPRAIAAPCRVAPRIRRGWRWSPMDVQAQKNPPGERVDCVCRTLVDTSGANAGAAYPNRTDDLLFTRQLLYQLS